MKAKTLNILDQLFLEARTHSTWLDKAVSSEQIQQIYDLVKMAPTSANCSPARFVFLTTPEAKQKLKPALSSGNVEKTMTAPVTVWLQPMQDFMTNCQNYFRMLMQNHGLHQVKP